MRIHQTELWQSAKKIKFQSPSNEALKKGENYLANEGGDPDDVINRVSEEPNKDVALSVDLACVNLIE